MDETHLQRLFDGPIMDLLGRFARDNGATARTLPGTLHAVRIEFPRQTSIMVLVTGGDGVTVTLFRTPNATRRTGVNAKPDTRDQSVSETFTPSIGIDAAIQQWLTRELAACREWIREELGERPERGSS